MERSRLTHSLSVLDEFISRDVIWCSEIVMSGEYIREVY